MPELTEAGRHPALRQPVDAQHVGRHALLSARQLHDEVQPQAARAALGLPGSATCIRYQRDDDDSSGDAGTAVRDAADARRDRRAARGLAAAGRRRAGRTHRAARRRGLLPRSGENRTKVLPAARTAPIPPVPRSPDSNASTQEQRRRLRRSRRAAEHLDERHRRVHDHQSEHAGPVRAADRRITDRCCTTSAAWSTSTART
jgi:hypothetical protein